MSVQIVKTIEATADDIGYHTTYEVVDVLGLYAPRNAGFIFRQIGINQGVVPTLVEFSFNVTGTSGSGGSGTIYGVAIDSARSWRNGINEIDRVAPITSLTPYTTASVSIPAQTSNGVKTFDVTAIFTEIFARSGWKPGHNIALVIDCGAGDPDSNPDYNIIASLSGTLTFTLSSLPAATSYRFMGHLEGQTIPLAGGDGELIYNTFQGLSELESQDIWVVPDGDADGITVDFEEPNDYGTVTPSSITFTNSEPELIRYKPSNTAFKHYLRGTNNGGLTDPTDKLFFVRRERLFPDSAVWYQPANQMQLDATGLHARFAPYSASGLTMFAGTKYEGHIVDQFINYREGSATPVAFDLTLYPTEGDEPAGGVLPMGENFMIEGYPYDDGDAHGLLVDVDNGILHETYKTEPDGDGYKGYHCQFDINSLDIRTPLGITSAAADGRPITPFVLTYDEVLKAVQSGGVVPHPLRFTVPLTALNVYGWDASHATSNGGSGSPMYGTRMRLKADYDISGFTPINQAILRTLKVYGMYLEDGGLTWYLSGENDHRWDTWELNQLTTVKPYLDFETVDQSPYKIANDSYEAFVGIAATPAAIPIRYTITITLSGAGTLWDGTTVFLLSGVSGVTKISQNVTGPLSATVTLETGDSTGTLTITESVTGSYSVDVSVQNEIEGLNVGTLTITAPGSISADVTVDTALISVSPVSGLLGTTPTLTITGTNTVWTQETPGTLLSITGGSGAALGTPTVNSDTEIVVTLSGGSGTGTLTIEDNSTEATDTFGVAAATAYFYTGSSTRRGAVNVAKTISLYANGTTTATVTGHTTGTGTFASTVALNGTTPVTLSYTPTDFADSPHTLSFTDSASLTDPSNITLTVTEHPDTNTGDNMHKKLRP